MTTTRKINQLDVAALLENAGDKARRRVAKAVVDLALDRHPVDDERIAAARRALEERRLGDTPERTALAELVQELDEDQWTLQEKLDENARGPHQSAYLAAFDRARAANALWYALSADATEAAGEAAYETWYALNDPEAVEAAIRGALAAA